MALITVAECKAFRNIEAENTEHDEELTRLIASVEEFLKQECGRTFEQATVTEYFSGGEWTDRLMLSRPPIVSITNIWDDIARVYATPIASSKYVIADAEAGIVRLDGLTFSRGINNIKVTYVGGYAAGAVPTDLAQAAIEMVWAARIKGDQNLVGIRSRSIADGSAQFLNLGWPLDQGPVIAKHSLRTGMR